MCITKIWEAEWQKLFCEKTNLFYDLAIGDGKDALTSHLPTPFHIKHQVPNPNGWGTGMEDSMLTAGSVMDALMSKLAIGGKSEEIKPLADKVFAGMMLCADISGGNGFLARSVSPEDGKSYYFNSSRDQYTHWIYGAVRFYRSGLCDDSQKADIRRVLVSFAEKARRDVVPENRYMLLRDDNKESIVCEMWGALGGHEYFRLPMFYLAAWYVSGDRSWYDEYKKYRDKAFEMSICPDVWKVRAYPILQMQYSLRLAYDIEEDADFRNKCAEKLDEIAVRYADFARKNVPALANAPETLSYNYLPWDKAPAILVGVYGDLPYYNPGQTSAPGNRFYELRNIGEALTVLALSPLRKVDERELEAVKLLAKVIDCKKHCTYAPLLLACGYYVALENVKSI